MQNVFKKFRLVNTPAANASYNMAVDEVLFHSSIETNTPTVRVYEWKNSITIGRFNSINTILDLKALDTKKISYTRRVTGGGILIHADDISYSISIPQYSINALDVKENYRYICGFILNFYKKLGLESKFAIDEDLSISKSNICTLANESYDITINAKKIGGNAQRYSKKSLFQHGSIPLKLDTKLYEMIFLEDAELEKILTLQKLGIHSSKEQLKQLMINSFQESFDVELVANRLTEEELEKVDELQRTKYDSGDWNLDALHL